MHQEEDEAQEKMYCGDVNLKRTKFDAVDPPDVDVGGRSC